MTRIAYFGHDASDSAIRRRVQAFRDDGLEVVGFMKRRADDVKTAWENVDLGRTFDGAYLQRIKSVFDGARRAAAERERLASADIIVARSMEMVATAFLAKRYAGLKTPVIYECLDVHRLLTRHDPIGFVFRRIEGALLDRCSRLVVSSPGFLDNHFARHHKGRYKAIVLENKNAAGADYGARPSREIEPVSLASPLRIGWMGVLRCSRSLDLLLGVAGQFKDRVRIEMHGMPAAREIPDFETRIAGFDNVAFHGRYRSPEDLAAIYAGVDIVWAGDFMEAGYNSVWLLPNRIYEGGYYAVPAIAPSGTQTSKWIEAHGVGFSEPEDLAATLPALVARLLDDRAPIAERRARLLALPDDTFIHQPGAHRAIIEEALADPHPRHASRGA